ncbi:MAG: hypothetical protein LBJ24_01755 [Treponema sp.]|jgi:hypothetical protein|nr:hypothetical protein [Treponema sp.]
MDTGELIYISSRLILGAAAAFLAIMLWSKTRDVAWMLVVIGIIAAYIETVYSVLDLFGLIGKSLVVVGSIPLVSIVLPNLPTIFFIAAFGVMVLRKYRRR